MSFFSNVSSNKVNQIESSLVERATSLSNFPRVAPEANDSGRLQRAVDSFGSDPGILFLPKGTLIGKFKIGSNITIYGAGKLATTIKLPDGSNDAIIQNKDFNLGANQNIKIFDCSFDGNYQNQTATGNQDKISGIYLSGANDIQIENCSFINCYQSSIWTINCKNVSVKRCITDRNYYHSGMSFWGDGSNQGKTIVADNIILNSALDGINAVDGNMEVINNYIYNSGCNLVDGHLPAAGIFSGSTSKHNVYKGNHIFNSSGIGIDIMGSYDIEVEGNVCAYNGCAGIWAYGTSKYIRIIGNTVYNNGSADTNQYYSGIGVADAGSTSMPSYCIIMGNTAYDDQTVKTQCRGIASFNSDNNIIVNNVTYGNKLADYQITGNGNSIIQAKGYLNNLEDRMVIDGSTKTGFDGRQLLQLLGSSDNTNIEIATNSKPIKFVDLSGNFVNINAAKVYGKGFLTVDLQSNTGYDGRHGMELYGSSDNNVFEIYTNKNWVSFVDGAGKARVVTFALQSGNTAGRPSNAVVGQPYFDTTLGKPVYCKSTSPNVWVDATGATV
jgi:parallel beta-helix repeat protein